MSSTDTQHRIERKLKLLSRIVIGLALYAAVITYCGMTSPRRIVSFDELSATSITIVDEQKKKVITLTSDSEVGGPCITLMDKKGKVRVALAYSGKGDSAYLHIADENRSRVGLSSHREGGKIRIWDKAGVEAVSLYVLDEDNDLRAIQLSGTKNEMVWMTLNPVRGSTLLTLGEQGKRAISMACVKEELSGLTFDDDRGVGRITLALQSGEQPIIGISNERGQRVAKLP